MKTNLRRIDRIFEAAEKDGRSFLLEPEVYDVLRLAGIVPPRFLFAAVGRKVARAELAALGSDTVVVKVVSPLIQHKSDVGGVEFVKADAAAVNRACARMLRTVPLRYLRWEAGTRRAGAGPGPSLAVGPRLDPRLPGHGEGPLRERRLRLRTPPRRPEHAGSSAPS